jgi:frataxin-like iron-binding protein CyaY
MTKEQMQQALIINGWEPIRQLWVTKTDGYKWAYSTEVAYHKMLNGKS